MRDLAREFRLAIRSLLRARGWSALAVLTLALGIGATTALFSVVYAVLLQALPYGRPDGLVHLWETTPTKQSPRQVSYPDFVDLRTETKSLSAVAGYGFAGFAWDTADGPRRLAGARVTANFFAVLEIGMQSGRNFLDSEDTVGGPQDAVILSSEFWRNSLGGVRPVVLGLFLATGVVLLIAGANLAGMSMARALGRRREIAVRSALGADRRALARQFFAESACLGAAGTLLGVPLAIAGVRALVASLPAAQLQRLPFLQHLGVHPMVLGFSVAVGLASAIVFGVAPALRTHARAAAETLRSGARTTGRGR